jgi:gluconolactonase
MKTTLLLSALLCAAPASAQGLWTDLVAPDAKTERIATGFRFTEGPAWHPNGYLLFTDIPNNAIVKWTPTNGDSRGEGKTEIFRQPSGNANGLMFNQAGQLLACEHSNRRVSQTVFGQVVTLADKFEGKRLNSPNDVDIAPDGSLYFTDPIYGLPRPQDKELDFEGVFRLSPDGKLTLLVKDFVHPNGIALSPDAKTIYINDSESKLNHMRAFDVQADGTLTNGRVFADMKVQGIPGAPDGLKVDPQGNIWTSGPGGVWVFSPAGKLLGKIAVPEVTTNLAFGGKDNKTLFITANTSVYRIQLKAGELKR